MAQWIKHRPTEPGIAGSSPAEIICSHADHVTQTCWVVPSGHGDSTRRVRSVLESDLVSPEVYCGAGHIHVLAGMHQPGIEPGSYDAAVPVEKGFQQINKVTPNIYKTY